MQYNLSQAIQFLVRTPDVLKVQLAGLPNKWLQANEGPGTWSPFQVVGHLIVNEQTNFLTRTLLILSSDEPKPLEPVNMVAHLHQYDAKKIEELLTEFAQLRRQSIQQLESLRISRKDLQKIAIHPKVGHVRLVNILATWVAHDLIHIGQITRVLAKQYKEETGPFIEFLPRLKLG